MSRGHVPLRTCVVCSAKTDKRALVRIVRSPSGSVEVDATGRLPGRGAYLCHKRECWDIALKKNRLDHRLKSSVSSEDRQALRGFAEGLALQAEAVQSA